MAGESPDFNAAEFRADIEAAMVMGLPKELELRPTFYWDAPVPAAVAGPGFRDSAGEEWNPNAPAPAPQPGDPTPRAPVQVPCAVEFGSGSAEQTSVGKLNANEAVLTFLDVHFAEVTPDGDAFDWCTLGGDRYRWDHEVPVGLYDVTVRQVIVVAWDES